jgi:hypothetical protein
MPRLQPGRERQRSADGVDAEGGVRKGRNALDVQVVGEDGALEKTVGAPDDNILLSEAEWTLHAALLADDSGETVMCSRAWLAVSGSTAIGRAGAGGRSGPRAARAARPRQCDQC